MNFDTVEGHALTGLLEHRRAAGRAGDLDRFGRYAVVEKLATGGMAELYKVRSPDHGPKIFTLKCIRSDCDDDPQFRRMLQDEAHIMRNLNHPNINRVIEVVEEHGEIGLILEHLDGLDLTRLRRHLKSKKAMLPLELAVHIAIEVLNGLDYAHAARDEDGEFLNVVHRDVSPGNVMVDVNGRVVLVDFGIAHAQNRLSKTEAGNVKGKFRYMSPEQIRGDHVGPSADVYAASMVLWEMLAGRRIYDDVGVAQLMIRVANAHVPPLSETRRGLPEKMYTVFAKATAMSTQERFHSARAFADALNEVLLEYDPRRCQRRLAELMRDACRESSMQGFDRAVAKARVAAENDLEDAILSALESPDRVEKIEVQREQLHRADSVRVPVFDSVDLQEPPTAPQEIPIRTDSTPPL